MFEDSLFPSIVRIPNLDLKDLSYHRTPMPKVLGSSLTNAHCVQLKSKNTVNLMKFVRSHDRRIRVA